MSRKVMFVVTTLGCLALASSVATAELVGYWPMSEGQGSVTADMSGNGHDGTLVGTPVWTEGPTGLGSAIEFGSGCTGVNCGEWNPSTVNNPDGTDVSFTLWLKRYDGGEDYQGIIANRDTWGSDDTTINWALELNADKNMQFGSRTGSTYGRGVVPGDEWVFLAGTFDGETFTVYQNAGEPSSGGASYGEDTNAPVRIGAAEQGGGNFNGVIDHVKLYDHILTLAEIQADMEIEAIPYASGASPRDSGTDVRLDPTLSWTAGAGAVSHDVYFGTSADELSVLAAGLGEATVAVPTKLAIETTYYWRVDETDAEGTLHEGPVWSFTTEPVAYPVTPVAVTETSISDEENSPSNLIDGSGLVDGGHDVNDMHMWTGESDGNDVALQFEFDRVYKLHDVQVWNYNLEVDVFLGFGVKDITIEYSVDANEWTTLGDFEIPRASYTADYAGVNLDLEGIVAKYVKFNMVSNRSSNGTAIYGLSEVAFAHVPVVAREVQPEDEATDVDLSPELSWRPGREAASHSVYVSTDSNAVADETVAPTVTEATSLDLQALELATTYYWKIVETNDAQTPAAWATDVMSFSTPDFIVVDDMESYDDEENRIYTTWIDGLDDTSNGGSQVAPDNPPFTEQDTVHDGDQAMRLQFGRSGQTFSEVDMAIGGADWTVGGATTLTVFFHGNLSNAPAKFYVKVNGYEVAFADTSAVTVPWWTQFNVDLASLPGGATNVTELTIGVADNTGQGTIYVDDIRLTKASAAAGSEQIWIEAEDAVSLPSPWEIVDDETVSGGKYIIAPSTTASNSTAGPSTSDTAKFEFTVAGGQYRIWLRLGAIPGYSNDSLYYRITSATALDPAGASPDRWIRANGLAGQDNTGDWHWGPAWDDENGNAHVTITLPAGTHTLEISYRELDWPLDLILITNDLDR